jgi:hypothetical protein
MTRDELVRFLRRYKLGVQSSISPSGSPQSAVVGVAITDDLEIIFDTLDTTRKCLNLRANPHCALVIGWDDEMTAQLEGVADFPVGTELDRVREVYLGVFPDGHERLTWPGITHVRVRPTWCRFSDFTKDPPHIVELNAAQLE